MKSISRTEWPLLVAIFLDLVGFGMAFPDIQLRAQEYGAQGWMIGALISSYFVVQFVVSPIWGRFSDQIGRKPVLLICTFLSALSMVAYAFIPSLWGILFSRVLAGVAAANVVVGQAFIADHSPEHTRTAAMGRVSSAIMIGLMAGPAIGGELATRFGNYGLGLTAAAASTLSFLWILFGVPNDRNREPRAPGKKNLVWKFDLFGQLPHLRRIFILAAAGWLVLACLEGTFGRLIHHNLGFGQRESGILFSYESLIGALMGILIARISRVVSPAVQLRLGYALQGLGVALMPLAPSLPTLFAASTFYAIGLGVVNPTINAVCSEQTPDDRQGELFGIMQATRSVGFLLGPTVGGALFDVEPGFPYYLAAGVALVAAVLVSIPERTATVAAQNSLGQ